MYVAIQGETTNWPDNLNLTVAILDFLTSICIMIDLDTSF